MYNGQKDKQWSIKHHTVNWRLNDTWKQGMSSDAPEEWQIPDPLVVPVTNITEIMLV